MSHEMHKIAEAEAVTNVAWARLTIPPRPVTITNDRKTSDRARPRVIRPTQNALATKNTYPISPAPAMIQGSLRLNGDRSSV